jgi:epoxyqueuosine reductase
LIAIELAHNIFNKHNEVVTVKNHPIPEVNLPQIEKAVSEFYLNNRLNAPSEMDNHEIFDKPLIGIASADDPMFELLKEDSIIGSHHLSPKEWLPEGKTVISYFMPFTEKVREENRKMGQPAKEWLFGRYEGEMFNNALRKYLVGWFQNEGFRAISPSLDSRFKVINVKSNWSERHIAYVAGLGTMSLSCSIITRKGSAGRLGSLIVDANIKQTVRPYTTKDEYCIHCGACVYRCPPLAITEQGKDHEVCKSYCDRTLMRFKPRYGCGKCQTDVPCENKIPGK